MVRFTPTDRKLPTKTRQEFSAPLCVVECPRAETPAGRPSVEHREVRSAPSQTRSPRSSPTTATLPSRLETAVRGKGAGSGFPKPGSRRAQTPAPPPSSAASHPRMVTRAFSSPGRAVERVSSHPPSLPLCPVAGPAVVGRGWSRLLSRRKGRASSLPPPEQTRRRELSSISAWDCVRLGRRWLLATWLRDRDRDLRHAPCNAERGAPNFFFVIA